MAYSDLIKTIFGEPLAVIPEDDFIRLLPELMKPTRKPRSTLKWTGERLITVLIMRFGLGGVRQHTLQEVGNAFGVQREQIRQVESRALRMLRYHSKVVLYTMQAAKD